MSIVANIRWPLVTAMNAVAGWPAVVDLRSWTCGPTDRNLIPEAIRAGVDREYTDCDFGNDASGGRCGAKRLPVTSFIGVTNSC